MMQLVIEHGAGDGCTWWCTCTIPVIYESAEAFAVDFEAFCLQNRDVRGYSNPKFAGHTWDMEDFFPCNQDSERGEYTAPEIYTVDEWFAHHNRA
jgi:hypothetical protein